MLYSTSSAKIFLIQIFLFQINNPIYFLYVKSIIKLDKWIINHYISLLYAKCLKIEHTNHQT